MNHESNSKQWLTVGWPLDAEANLQKEVDARLDESADDGTYIVTHGTVPLSTVGLERVGDIEIIPGVLALHQAPSTQRDEFLANIPTDDTQQSKTADPTSLPKRIKNHAPGNFAEFSIRLAQIKHACLETGTSQTYSPQRVMTDWETAREISYLIATYFGFSVLHDATITHDPNSSDLYHQTLRVTFESPVDGPSLLHGTIERNVEGIITLDLWYRFTTPGPWHLFCARELDEVDEIYLLDLMRAHIIELTAFAEHGFTCDEMISHLGRLHDYVENSTWAQSQLAANDAVEDQANPLSKLKKMYFE